VNPFGVGAIKKEGREKKSIGEGQKIVSTHTIGGLASSRLAWTRRTKVRGPLEEQTKMKKKSQGGNPQRNRK